MFSSVFLVSVTSFPSIPLVCSWYVFILKKQQNGLQQTDKTLHFFRIVIRSIDGQTLVIFQYRDWIDMIWETDFA